MDKHAVYFQTELAIRHAMIGMQLGEANRRALIKTPRQDSPPASNYHHLRKSECKSLCIDRRIVHFYIYRAVRVTQLYCFRSLMPDNLDHVICDTVSYVSSIKSA